MRKVFLALLTVILVIGVLAGAGFVGYRIGYEQGAQASDNTNASPSNAREFNWERGPFSQDREFERGFNRGFPLMRRGGGFGFFRPFMFLGNLLFWGLILLLAYWLFTRSGWRLTRTEQTVQQTSPNIQTTVQEEETKNEQVVKT